MKAYEVRPHFELAVDASAKETLDCIKRHLAEQRVYEGWVNAPYAELRLPQEHRQLWTPLMAVETEDTDDGARVRCRLQPESAVWTMFMMAAFAVVVAFLGALFLGASQWLAAETPWAAYIGMPVAASAGTSLYVLVLVGKKLGADQMEALTDAIRCCLEELQPKEVA